MMSNDRSRGEMRAREELRNWARARLYWERAFEALVMARRTSDRDVQARYVTIAQHYRALAEAEERSANRKGAERRSRAAAERPALSPP